MKILLGLILIILGVAVFGAVGAGQIFTPYRLADGLINLGIGSLLTAGGYTLLKKGVLEDV